MKEIIYIQAGSISNYVGTHFWNAQETYFTYEEGDDPYVNHDVSFREGQTLKGEPTFCPRLLLFDRKSNFGALGRGMYGEEESENAVLSQWNGAVDELRQPAVPKSKYQTCLESGDDVSQEDSKDIRYWSDYSHVSYHPRTPQRLPDVADYENTEGDWELSRDAFTKYNESTDLMEDAFRFFVEECDNIQGLQIMNDTSTFGGFTHSFLSAFRDEFTKLPSWTFSFLSDSIPVSLNVDDPRSIMKALNDALCLQGLNGLSTMTIPFYSPLLWEKGSWLSEIDLKDSLFQSASIISTHVETITLPLRLKNSQHTMTNLSSALTTRGNQRIGHLAGTFPVQENVRDLETKLYDLTLNTSKLSKPDQCSGCVDVSRGFSEPLKLKHSDWRGGWRQGAIIVESPAILPPTSFPRYFKSGTTPSSLSALTTLTTTSRTASLFGQYAKLADNCTKQYAHVIQQMGLEMDDVKELRDTLHVLEDEYRGDETNSDDEDELGEDEE
ncbi:tubulin nucleotide-binding domain-like protein [Cristinia sonorae]|uniref:Tubulin nucleotide-binding domain-like protein n=1 Tax=Cristinia sonorae TaxID=1940300 RepID=A0A8K0UPL8_9AGAR|nr:tubulin nucleotide-binding domain-like protein [Cristinia sonorae]